MKGLGNVIFKCFCKDVKDVHDTFIKPVAKELTKGITTTAKTTTEVSKTIADEWLKTYHDEEIQKSITEMKQNWNELVTTIKNTKTENKETLKEESKQTRQYWCDNTIMLSNNVHVSIIYNGMTIKVDKILNREVKVLKVIKGKYHNVEVHVDLLINK